MMLPVKPFVKWAGGKTRLLPQLEKSFPPEMRSGRPLTYIEPFVGGGAMLFHLLRSGTPLRRVVINDINADLVSCYRMVRDEPDHLIGELRRIESIHRYMPSDGGRKELFYAHRFRYNEAQDVSEAERAAMFMYLNHTCFNGLYRVNRSGAFNVPYGRMAQPCICNEDVIRADSKALRGVDLTVLCGDYQAVERYVEHGATFVYLDPPYKPLNATSAFKEYSNAPFGDEQQEQLKSFCDRLSALGTRWMLSNSDAREDDGSSYFESLYAGYRCRRVSAPRYINANGAGRGTQPEMLITNY